MDTPIIYFSLSGSMMVNRTPVLIGDIATIYCTDNRLKHYVESIQVPIAFSSDKRQAVVTALKIVELITASIDTPVNHIGSSEVVVYYKPMGTQKRGIKATAKSLLFILIAFFGTGYSIMSYNGDVGTRFLLEDLFTIFTGSYDTSSPGITYGIISYSVGLCIGMIVFFNHGINKNSQYDPTPLEVQLRTYEQEVNTCITINSERKKETIDVD